MPRSVIAGPVSVCGGRECSHQLYPVGGKGGRHKLCASGGLTGASDCMTPSGSMCRRTRRTFCAPTVPKPAACVTVALTLKRKSGAEVTAANHPTKTLFSFTEYISRASMLVINADFSNCFLV